VKELDRVTVARAVVFVQQGKCRAGDFIGIGGVECLHYGTKVAFKDLPRTRFTYKGREPDAPWRQAALARIERIRKGDIAVRVFDAAARHLSFTRAADELAVTPAAVGQQIRALRSGADVIIGNHVHYVAAMEVYKGKPIWYALGNFVFDQNWSEQTEEGLVLELTFNGGSLVQAWMHPILDLSNCQPNLLDASSGKVVLNQLYTASAKLPTWK